MHDPPLGSVYFLVMKQPGDPEHDFSLVKIGITRGDVLLRLSRLQTGNPFDLVCFDSFSTPWPRQVEHYLHRANADEMQQTEWLRCRGDRLRDLVVQARAFAAQIESRKSKELQFLSRASNGETRRATPEEFKLHIACRKVLKELVPAQLRLKAAESRLKASTGQTLGIPGVVTVRYVPATIRFSARLALERFPDLAAECATDEVRGVFRWRNAPRPQAFPAENLLASEHEAAAEASEQETLASGREPEGWADRTADLERCHDEFLTATRSVHRLKADLADLRTELILSLGDYDALDPVCSFRRQNRSIVKRAMFCGNYPEQAEQCAAYVPAMLRKYVYKSRSY